MRRIQSCNFWSKSETIFGLALLFSASGCQPSPNSKANSNKQPGISRAILANPNAESATSGVTINAREPEKYSATLQLSIETEGADKAAGTPSLAVQIARNASNRRFEFKLPDGTPLIYLDHNHHHYVIVPARKQYAELTAEAADEQMQKLMTPDELVEDLRGLTGVERAGEAPVNGRAAEKYRYSAGDKNAKGVDAKAESFIYVDKETGLPLRAEKLPRRSADKITRLVIEMRDLKTDIETSLFEVPDGYAQVAPEKVRPQIDALTNELAAALKAMMANASNPAASPAASASPKSN
jgi:outer membrane lipoprotein-sorting protein